MSIKWMRILFVFAGIYDGVLGLAFLLYPAQLFDHFGVPPPNHMGYVHFSALLLLVFAVMFFRVAANPVKNRELILYGCGLKTAYCATVFGHAAWGAIPSIWLPWAWADLGFLALFLLAWWQLRRKAVPAQDR